MDVPTNSPDLKTRAIQAKQLFDRAEALVSSGHPNYDQEVVELWLSALKTLPEWPQIFPAWSYKLRFVGESAIEHGDYQGGMEVIQNALRIENVIRQSSDLDILGFRILSNRNIPAHIGHLAIEIETLLKLQKCGLIEKFNPVLLATTHVANNCLLDYWKPYLHLIQDARAAQLLEPLRPFLTFDTWYLDLPNQGFVDIQQAYIIAQKEWKARSAPPLLEISPDHAERGWASLAKFGIQHKDWFVAIHVRESGFHHEASNSPTGAFRNSDIITYLPSIKAITDQGGWVVRLGDRTMRPLPQMEKVIDYAHSEIKSDWMDVFLCATCRFFYGTNSGMCCLPPLFGRSRVLVNYLPLVNLPMCLDDLVLVKTILDDQGKLVPFRNQVSHPFCHKSYDRLIIEGYRCCDNTAEDLLEVVYEKLNTSANTERDKSTVELQESFNLAVDSPFSNRAKPNIGAAFLKKHKELL